MFIAITVLLHIPMLTTGVIGIHSIEAIRFMNLGSYQRQITSYLDTIFRVISDNQVSRINNKTMNYIHFFSFVRIYIRV